MTFKTLLAILLLVFAAVLLAHRVVTSLEHTHTCHVEHVYVDDTVSYPPTIWEANCDGANIKLYSD
jgi:hypothetical protein